MADKVEDLDDIPTNCAIGSTTLIISTGETYMLNSERKWTVLGSKASSTTTTVEKVPVLDSLLDGGSAFDEFDEISDGGSAREEKG